MFTNSWLVIKDDTKRTFEICGQTDNTNAFTNRLLAMQKLGMRVSGSTPPVSNKDITKEVARMSGYRREEGLFERLKREHLKVMMGGVEE